MLPQQYTPTYVVPLKPSCDACTCAHLHRLVRYVAVAVDQVGMMAGAALRSRVKTCILRGNPANEVTTTHLNLTGVGSHTEPSLSDFVVRAGSAYSGGATYTHAQRIHSILNFACLDCTCIHRLIMRRCSCPLASQRARASLGRQHQA